MELQNKLTVHALRFPVTIRQGVDGLKVIPVILTKDQLRAAQTVGQSSKELIRRICERAGFTVLDIGKAERRTLEIDLSTAWER